MGKYVSVFERKEKKYLISERQYAELMRVLLGRVTTNEYSFATICSLYFDTPDHRLIRESIDRPAYKEKLRVRSYGVPGEDDDVFVEIKKKYMGVVGKRRVPMKLRDARAYFKSGLYDAGGSQIMREIDWFMHFHAPLAPAMLISCEREAYYGTDDRELRITFDKNILFRGYDLDLASGAYGEPLLQSGERLMEIKTPGTMPLWLARALGGLDIYSASFSKYGTAYKLALSREASNKKEADACA